LAERLAAQRLIPQDKFVIPVSIHPDKNCRESKVMKNLCHSRRLLFQGQFGKLLQADAGGSKEPEAVAEGKFHCSQVCLIGKYGGPVGAWFQVVCGLDGERDTLKVFVQIYAFHGMNRNGLAGARYGFNRRAQGHKLHVIL
jgi:hypothetical protein